ncbi:hypothetical protein ACN9MZ_00195 [Pseudoduganella sp. S-14]|jgi:hypothetical protein|uniref:hypothetical protein n=1 Tax=Pseudoduganella sp. S-14 TaxID=3404065 RepID=UPI003CF6DF92
METLIKLGMLAVGTIGAAKLILELMLGKRGRMREEYRFTREFLQELKADPQMHPLAREQGYKAIAGDASMSADEIEYLISLTNPDKVMKNYVLGRKYLEHLPDAGALQVNFKLKYRQTIARKCRLAGFFLFYLGITILVFSPLILSSSLQLSPNNGVMLFIALFITLWPYAYLSLRETVRIRCAEKLVANQERHTGKLLTAERPNSHRRGSSTE